MTEISPPFASDARHQEILRDHENRWSRAFGLPGAAVLEALLDWIERRP